MKICTITCHDVYNHGASLQAFALMKYLQNCGHEVEIIDYKPDYLSNHYNLLSINNPRWNRNMLYKSIYLSLKIPERLLSLRRKRSFDKFKSKYLKITKRKYCSNNDLKDDLPPADAYICGSDQIWNSLHRNGRDPAFYLDFAPESSIKLSYAASFATDSILDEYRAMIKERVAKLDGISVRERSGLEILQGLDIRDAVNVVDPVFLLDREDWDCIGRRQFNEKYILVYDFDNSNLIKNIAEAISKEKGYRIYSINSGKLRYANRYFHYDAPDVFVSLIRDAQFVLSNSFHAAVLSIIFKKNFAIVNRTESINTRMRDLLEDLGLEERLINVKYSVQDLLKEIEYRDSFKILKEKIILSKEYLEEVLSIKR